MTNAQVSTIKPYRSTLSKDMRNNWCAQSNFRLPVEDKHGKAPYELHITTMKRSNGQLITNATVQKVEGNFFVFASGHFNRTVVSEKVRVTEKAVQLQHNKIIGDADGIQKLISDAIEHHEERQVEPA